MEFKIDEQTLNDLELFNQALDGKSISLVSIPLALTGERLV